MEQEIEKRSKKTSHLEQNSQLSKPHISSCFIGNCWTGSQKHPWAYHSDNSKKYYLKVSQGKDQKEEV